MKRVIGFALLVLLFGGVVAVYNLVREKIGDIRPAIIPSQENLAEKIIKQTVGQEPDVPVNLPDGFKAGVFSTDLPGVRDLQMSPQGTLLATLPNERTVVALPDKNNNGVSDEVINVLVRLNRPHGIAFHNSKLFVAEETKVVRYRYDEKNFTAIPEQTLFELPKGGRHTTRTIVFDREGDMYVSLGSTCDTCVEKHPFIGTVIISDAMGKTPRVYSKGLRNAVFLTTDTTGNVWASEMGRDFLGDNLPPDEVNILTDNGDFGWPFCYGDQVWDSMFGQKDQEYCNNTIKPFYKIPAHSAPLGLTFINSPQFPEEWQGDLLVAYHGSWNRSTPTGYKVVRVTVGETPTETDFMTGFIEGGRALGRPVDVEFDSTGSLYVSDDKAGAVYKIIHESN